MTRELLVKAGYDLRFRRDQWVECFASCGPERWRGKGCDEADAIEDVLQQMLPSSLARALFTRQFLVESLSVEDAIPAHAPPVEDCDAALAPRVDAPLDEAEPPPAALAPATNAPPEESEPPPAALAPATNAPLYESEPPPAAPSEPPVITPRAARFLPVGASAAARAAPSARPVFFTLPERGLFAVAGGRAASSGGDLASAMAVEVVGKAIEAEPPLSSSVRRKGMPLLVAAIERANAEVFAAGKEDPALRRAGTTLAVALVVGRQAVLASVGDGRIYRLRRGALEQLVPEDAPAGPRARAVGCYKAVEAAVWMVTVLPSDTLVLCTPGVHAAVTDGEIESLLVGCPVLAAAVGRLTAIAGGRGRDDAAIVAVRCDGQAD